MKNQRNICAATEAGYIQYHHLPGSIKTGCQLSPLSTSKYCYLHAPRVCVGMSVQASDLGCEQSNSQPVPDNTCKGVLRFVTGKKITRNQVYYQVKKFYWVCIHVFRVTLTVTLFLSLRLTWHIIGGMAWSRGESNLGTILVCTTNIDCRLWSWSETHRWSLYWQEVWSHKSYSVYGLKQCRDKTIKSKKKAKVTPVYDKGYVAINFIANRPTQLCTCL